MEPFGIATGALQVAGAGYQLAKTLHHYISTTKNAHNHIKAVAIEVKVRPIEGKTTARTRLLPSPIWTQVETQLELQHANRYAFS